MIKKYIKKFLKEILPVFVVNLLTKNKGSYEGVYKNHKEITQNLKNPWASKTHSKHKEKQLFVNEKNLQKNTFHINNLCNTVNILKYLDSNKKFCIFDIGGSTGLYYPLLKNRLDNICGDFKYIVYDSANLIKIGMDHYQNNDLIDFVDRNTISLEEIFTSLIKENYSISVYISGTLQYVIPYKELLSQIAKNKPNSITITRLPVCNDPLLDAFSVQHVYDVRNRFCGSTIVNLISEKSLKKEMESLNYLNISSDFMNKFDFSNEKWRNKCPNNDYFRITNMALSFLRSDLFNK